MRRCASLQGSYRCDLRPPFTLDAPLSSRDARTSMCEACENLKVTILATGAAHLAYVATKSPKRARRSGAEACRLQLNAKTDGPHDQV